MITTPCAILFFSVIIVERGLLKTENSTLCIQLNNRITYWWMLCFRLHNGYILHFWKMKMLIWFHLKFLKVFHDITWETAWISVQVMHSWIRKIISHVFCHKFNNFPLLKAWKISKKVDMTSMKLPSNFNCFIWYHMLINSHTCKLEAAKLN